MKNSFLKASLFFFGVCIVPSVLASTYTATGNETPFSVLVIDDNNDYDEIVIPAGVKYRQRIHILAGRTNDVVIRGLNKSTSWLAPNGDTGVSEPDAKELYGKQLSNIYANCSCQVIVSKLKSRNPRKFHILGDTANTKVMVNDVFLHTIIGAGNTDHDHHTTDGFGGGTGSRISNSEINTYDDSIKIYRNPINVESVKIFHNLWGAPFQFGWGGFDVGKLILKGTNQVVDKHTVANEYRHGVFGWSYTNNTGMVRTVDFQGTLSHTKATGFVKGPLYTFGRIGDTTNVVTQGQVNLIGANCIPSTSANTQNRQNASSFSFPQNCN